MTDDAGMDLQVAQLSTQTDQEVHSRTTLSWVDWQLPLFIALCAIAGTILFTFLVSNLFSHCKSKLQDDCRKIVRLRDNSRGPTFTLFSVTSTSKASQLDRSNTWLASAMEHSIKYTIVQYIVKIVQQILLWLRKQMSREKDTEDGDRQGLVEECATCCPPDKLTKDTKGPVEAEWVHEAAAKPPAAPAHPTQPIPQASGLPQVNIRRHDLHNDINPYRPGSHYSGATCGCRVFLLVYPSMCMKKSYVKVARKTARFVRTKKNRNRYKLSVETGDVRGDTGT